MWIIWHRSNTRGRDDDEHVRCFLITPDMSYRSGVNWWTAPNNTANNGEKGGTNPRGNFMETDLVHPSTIHLP